MSYFGLVGGTDLSSFFGVSSYSKNNSMGNMNFLSDYASIRSGSYYKLLKAYYGGNSKLEPLVPDDKTAISKDEAEKLTRIEESADSLKEAADALYTKGSDSVFKEVEKTAEDGAKTRGYDEEAIYKAVNRFVESYNNLLDSAEDVSSKALEQSVKSLMNTTRVNEKLLEKIGISADKDGTLTLHEETFKEADMNRVKDLFHGTGSYGYQISMRASMVDYAAEREAAKANTYNKYGNYNNNYNYSFNSYI